MAENRLHQSAKGSATVEQDPTESQVRQVILTYVMRSCKKCHQCPQRLQTTSKEPLLFSVRSLLCAACQQNWTAVSDVFSSRVLTGHNGRDAQ